MFRRWLRLAGKMVAVALAVTMAFGVFSAAQARKRDPQVSPALDGPDVAGVCDDRALLAGPIEAPAGAVVVRATDSVQAAIDAHPERTTFWLPDGLYALTGPVTPRSGDTFVGGPDTVIDGGGTATSAFKAGREFSPVWVMADDVTLRSLTVARFVAPLDQVVVNADAGDGWTLDRVTVADNGGGGVMLGSRTTIVDSCLTRNGQYGFNSYRCRGYGDDGCTTSTTVTDVRIEHSEIAYNDTDQLAIERPGCGCSGGGKFWDVRGARVTGNWVHHNNSVGLWADTNDADFLFEGNVIEDNDAAGLMYEISYSARVVGNTFRRNAIGAGSRRLAEGPDDYFPDGALYISESGGDAAALAARDRRQHLRRQLERRGAVGVVGPLLLVGGEHVVGLLHASPRFVRSERRGEGAVPGADRRVPRHVSLEDAERRRAQQPVLDRPDQGRARLRRGRRPLRPQRHPEPVGCVPRVSGRGRATSDPVRPGQRVPSQRLPGHVAVQRVRPGAHVGAFDRDVVGDRARGRSDHIWPLVVARARHRPGRRLGATAAAASSPAPDHDDRTAAVDHHDDLDDRATDHRAADLDDDRRAAVDHHDDCGAAGHVDVDDDRRATIDHDEHHRPAAGGHDDDHRLLVRERTTEAVSGAARRISSVTARRPPW
jgi:hypothetical protein